MRIMAIPERVVNNLQFMLNWWIIAGMRLFEGYPRLSDDVVLLQKMSPDDADALHALATNPKVYKYLPTFLFERKYDAQEVIKRLDDECLKTNDCVLLGVYLKKDPEQRHY